jgi:hypothetical protein
VTSTQDRGSDSDMYLKGNESSDMSSDNADTMNELDRYLATRRIKDVKDPLAWWYENRGSYPRLWWMAWDYLTIPGTSLVTHTTIELIVTSVFQPQVLRLNAYSVKAALLSLIPATVCRRDQSRLFYALGSGLQQDMYINLT